MYNNIINHIKKGVFFMKLLRVTASFLSVIVSAGLIAGAFSGCQKKEAPPSDSTYLQNVSEYSF